MQQIQQGRIRVVLPKASHEIPDMSRVQRLLPVVSLALLAGAFWVLHLV